MARELMERLRPGDAGCKKLTSLFGEFDLKVVFALRSEYGPQLEILRLDWTSITSRYALHGCLHVGLGAL